MLLNILLTRGILLPNLSKNKCDSEKYLITFVLELKRDVNVTCGYVHQRQTVHNCVVKDSVVPLCV